MNCDFLHTRFWRMETTQSLNQTHSTKIQQDLLVCFVSEAHTWLHKITFQNNISVFFFFFFRRGSTINHPNCNSVCVICIHHLHEAENRCAYSKLREIVSHCTKLQECNCRAALMGSIWLQSLPCVSHAGTSTAVGYRRRSSSISDEFPQFTAVCNYDLKDKISEWEFIIFYNVLTLWKGHVFLNFLFWNCGNTINPDWVKAQLIS